MATADVGDTSSIIRRVASGFSNADGVAFSGVTREKIQRSLSAYSTFVDVI